MPMNGKNKRTQLTKYIRMWKTQCHNNHWCVGMVYSTHGKVLGWLHWNPSRWTWWTPFPSFPRWAALRKASRSAAVGRTAAAHGAPRPVPAVEPGRAAAAGAPWRAPATGVGDGQGTVVTWAEVTVSCWTPYRIVIFIRVHMCSYCKYNVNTWLGLVWFDDV